MKKSVVPITHESFLGVYLPFEPNEGVDDALAVITVAPRPTRKERLSGVAKVAVGGVFALTGLGIISAGVTSVGDAIHQHRDVKTYSASEVADRRSGNTYDAQIDTQNAKYAKTGLREDIIIASVSLVGGLGSTAMGFTLLDMMDSDGRSKDSIPEVAAGDEASIAEIEQ